MGNGIEFFDIIIFAMLAGYLVFQLRRVLGRRTGNDQQRPNPAPRQQIEDPEREEVIQIPSPDSPDAARREAATEFTAEMSPLTRLKAMDPDYDDREFLRGARSAFEWIVMAYARGDINELAGLLSPQVLVNFQAAIDERERSGETLEVTISSIKSAMIDDVRIEDSTVYITVEFISDQVKLLRDANNDIIEGTDDRLETLTDVWTFARDVVSDDPNWQLVDIREPDD